MVVQIYCQAIRLSNVKNKYFTIPPGFLRIYRGARCLMAFTDFPIVQSRNSRSQATCRAQHARRGTLSQKKTENKAFSGVLLQK